MANLGHYLIRTWRKTLKSKRQEPIETINATIDAREDMRNLKQYLDNLPAWICEVEIYKITGNGNMTRLAHKVR